MRTSQFLKRTYQLFILALCYCLSVGCTMMDDLSVKNEYDIPITVKFTYVLMDGKSGFHIIGTVPAHETKLFPAGTQRGGGCLDNSIIEDQQGNCLDKLKYSDATATHKSLGCGRSQTIWNVTVAPKPTKSSTVAHAAPQENGANERQ